MELKGVADRIIAVTVKTKEHGKKEFDAVLVSYDSNL